MGGDSMKCRLPSIKSECMWYVDEECAVLKTKRGY